jgi:predicted ATP-grasp superfamily ATP-dependent carboligase
MRIFIYEWATGGGLVEERAPLPASFIHEGMAMIGALAADFLRSEGCRVTALRDPRVLSLALPGCDVIDVLSRSSHDEELLRLASEADATILIAPEFDNILLAAAERVGSGGGRLLSPSPEFIRISANKQRTCELLAAAGVPTPSGRVLEPEETLPEKFEYPAVLKPIDGAGSQDTYLVSGPHDSPPAYAWPRRLESFIPGMAASVACLCGLGMRIVLPACRQRISDDGRLRYLGGELPLATGLAQRAEGLAGRAVAALPATTGYVGVDLVLGREPDGSGDAVIEVNPRLTTSYVGLRATVRTNLADAMWKVARGNCVQIERLDQRLEFDTLGNVSFLP